MSDYDDDLAASLTPLPDPYVSDSDVDPWAPVERVDPPEQVLGPDPDSPDHAPFTVAGLHAPYRTWQDLMAGYQSEHDHPRILSKTGYCLWMVITMLHGPNTGIYDAATGLRMSLNVHRDGSTPPAGAVLWWSNSGHGHIAVSAGGGYTWSTDILGNGRVWKVPISMIRARWGETYVGWTDNFCGQFNVSLAGGVTPDRPVVSLPAISLTRVNAAQRIEQAAPRSTVTYPLAKVVEQAFVKIGVTQASGANSDGHLGTGYTAAVRVFQNAHSGGGDGVLGPREFALLAKMSGLFRAVA